MKAFALCVTLGLLAAPAAAGAQGRDCSALPTSAQRARACNPRQECLAKVARLPGDPHPPPRPPPPPGRGASPPLV